MKQRAKLAQALVHDPRLVLLDEPTNGLDPSSRDDMLALVRRIGTEFGIAVLVTSHLLGELERISDHVVVLDSGKLLQSSATQDFMHTTGNLLVEVQGRTDADRILGQALIERGLRAWPSGRDGRGRGAGRHHPRRGPRPRRRPRPRTGPDAGAAPPDRGRLPRGRCRQCPAHLRPPIATPAPAGVIHDIGYRPYAGPRLGEREVAWAFFVTGLRNCFGLGRSGQVEDPADDPARPDAAAGADPGRRAGAGQGPARPRRADRAVLRLPADHSAADLGVRRRPGARADLARPAVPHDHALPRAPVQPDVVRAGPDGVADRGHVPPDRRSAAAHVRRRAAGRPAGRPGDAGLPRRARRRRAAVRLPGRRWPRSSRR